MLRRRSKHLHQRAKDRAADPMSLSVNAKQPASKQAR